MALPLPDRLIERLLNDPQALDKFKDNLLPLDGKNACWLWAGSTHRTTEQQGYFRYKGHALSVGRISWSIAHGQAPDEGSKIWRRCGNTLCVNPQHLYLVDIHFVPEKEYCTRGHELKEGNIYVTTQGKRTCRACIQLRSKSPEVREAAKAWKTRNPVRVREQHVKDRRRRQRRDLVANLPRKEAIQWIDHAVKSGMPRKEGDELLAWLGYSET